MRFEAFTAIECSEVVSGDQLCKSGRFAVTAASRITQPAHTHLITMQHELSQMAF
jgi:hypothetical protein